MDEVQMEECLRGRISVYNNVNKNNLSLSVQERPSFKTKEGMEFVSLSLLGIGQSG
jgi:hypothetical protein